MKTQKLKVGDKVYLSHDLGVPYEKLASHPGTVLAPKAGMDVEKPYVYVEVLIGKGKKERYLFHPEQVKKERAKEFLALWRELERKQKYIDKIHKIFEWMDEEGA